MDDLTGREAQRIINCVAPIRICDNGGWTDTWFAKTGKIFNIGVYPYVEVQVEVLRMTLRGSKSWSLLRTMGNVLRSPTRNPVGTNIRCFRRPLLDESSFEPGFEVTIYSDAPSGASTGTSAAVAVALVGALDRLTPGHLTAHEVAYTAQAIETEMLKLQCGIQDQLCSAYGALTTLKCSIIRELPFPRFRSRTQLGGSLNDAWC